MLDLLAHLYPWTKSLHVISVIAWMAGIFYLPRLFVYHVERVGATGETAELFQTMERRLLKAIMNPAMIATWLFGLCLVATPGAVDWGMWWPWIKLVMILGMTWFHMWLAARRKDLLLDQPQLSGRRYRIMNEVPTLFMIVIVVMVIAKPF